MQTLCGREDGETSSLTCSVCAAIMPSQHEFTRHIRTHNRVIEANHGLKMYECGICKKQLSSNSSLDRHMLVHSGERPFRCHICGTHFTTNGNMHRHIRGHYRNNGAGGACTGSDTGDSDGCSEDLSSPKKRLLEDGDEDGAGGKLARLSDDEDDDNSKDISCPACGIEQTSQHALEQHVEEEHPEYQVSCSTCHVGFRSYRALHLHNYMVHKSQTTPPRLDLIDFTSPKFPLYAKEVCVARQDDARESGHRCSICGVSFPCAESWLLHMKDHTTAVQLTCHRCNITLSSVGELAQHNERHMCEDTPPHKDSFLALLDLRNRANAASFASNQATQSSCTFSPASRDSPILVSLPNVISRVSPSDSVQKQESLNLINQLPRVSLNQSNVTSQSHEDQFAKEYRDMKLNGQYPCRICKEVFANLRKLKSHNLVHMLSPPYRCNLCSFYSNDKNTLKEHMKTHKGDTPFECTLCGLAFTTKANCERHIKNIHGRQTRDEVKLCMSYTPLDETNQCSERTLETVCHICKIDCKTRSVLRDHIRSSHPEGVDKPYVCKICQSSFPSHNDTFRHMIQMHHEVVTSGSIDGFIMERKPRDEVQDLSSIESLLNLSSLQFPINTVQQSPQRSISSVSITPGAPKIPHFPQTLPIGAPTVDITPSISITPTNLPPDAAEYINRAVTPPQVDDDAPLDLSITKRECDDKESIETEAPLSKKPHKESTKSESINQDEPEDLSQPHKKGDENSGQINIPLSASPDSFSDSSETLKIPKPNFPMMYPSAMHLYSFRQQYPLLMNPFVNLSPVPNFNSSFLDEYQKEMKRGFQLSSGGSLLTNGGGILPRSSPSFHISSALALAAAQQDQLKIPSADIRSHESKDDSKIPTSDIQVSSGNQPSEDDMLHFTMRNSVLVKKPKQRRYRTERPWRCDLCDKGFTLRSNMERHMKQQHPDIWQQRPRGPATPKSSSGTLVSSEQSQSIVDTREHLKIKHDKDSFDTSNNSEEQGKEEEESELVIDDCEDDDGDADDDFEEIDEDEEDERERSGQISEEGQPDLASVHKLLSTATSQSFPFFRKGEEDNCDDDSSDNCHSSDDGKRSAYSSAPQKQKCPYCSRKFPWSSSLVRHIRTHTGQKPYLCPVCHFPFTTKSNCDRHLQRKHPDTPITSGADRPYRCSKCPGAAFASLESLRKHEVCRHEKANDTLVKTGEEIVQNLKCHICETTLPSNKHALDHVAKFHPEQSSALAPALTATTYNNNDFDTSSPDSTTNDIVSKLLYFIYLFT